MLCVDVANTVAGASSDADVRLNARGFSLPIAAPAANQSAEIESHGLRAHKKENP
jgi:hypothetical protein